MNNELDRTWTHGIASGSTRRRFLARLGASGLFAATAIFARSVPAFATCDGHCCNLIYCPGNVPYNWCALHGYYVWNCPDGTGRTCSCCECDGCSAQDCF